jgi:serine/threonine protein kinase
LLPTGTRLGPYEIVEAIGAGGMGEVYRGRDTRLDRSVAIKVLPPHLSSDPALKLRFEREARVISGLNHPHICTLHDVGESDGVGFLVMELMDGQTLADRLAKGALPADQVLRYGIQIADALDKAHRSGIVHRDLKPANVMLTKSGAKLLDFGLAKGSREIVPIREGAGEQPASSFPTVARNDITAEGTIIGTFQYMAPEQLEGREADARTDIFAFGAILYEMITGRRAFDGKSRASVIASILEHEPQPISEIQPLTPPGLDRVVRTCLTKDPDDRWQNAHDLKRELEWIRDGLSAPSAQAVSTTRRPRRERLAWSLAMLLPILAIAATWLWMRASAPPPPRLVTSIAPPIGTEFVVTGDAAGPVTLSPDGRHAVYAALSAKGPALWITSFETGVTTQLPGTEKASFPFWSPDSRSIAFFAASKLQITDIEGTPPRPIADAPDGRGGAWGPDGKIVFSPYTQAGLSIVSVSGTNATPITRIAAPYTTHRWPAFLPDGKHFVYLAATHASPDNPQTAIFFASLDGKVNRKLADSLGNGVPWGDYLLYLRADRLLAHRLENGVLQGEPVTIRENVLYDPGTWHSVFSVSTTGRLVAHSGSRGVGSPAIWLDRSGKQIGEIGPPALYRDVTISPDGTKVAMTIGDPKTTLYIHDLVRGVRTRFSFVDGAAGAPIWSRDGRYIVFQNTVAGRFELYVKPADGSAPERKLFDGTDICRPSDISPDGRLVLFDDGTGPEGDVVAIPIAGGKSFPIVSGPMQQYDGQISPDGRWMIHIAADSSGRPLLLSQYPPRGGKWQVSTEPAYWAFWNSNGREIVYLSGYDVKSVAVSFEGDSVQLGTPTPLFSVNLNTNERGLSIAPDGTRFLACVVRSEESGTATLVTNFDRDLR